MKSLFGAIFSFLKIPALEHCLFLIEPSERPYLFVFMHYPAQNRFALLLEMLFLPVIFEQVLIKLFYYIMDKWSDSFL